MQRQKSKRNNTLCCSQSKERSDHKIRFIQLRKTDVIKFLKYLLVRFKIFVREKGRPIYIEYDKYDLIAKHFALEYNSKIIGSSRMYAVKGKTMIGRIGILKEYRGKGFGALIMKNLINIAKANKDLNSIYLGTELDTKDFHKKFGFRYTGWRQIILGAVHIRMKKDLSSSN